MYFELTSGILVRKWAIRLTQGRLVNYCLNAYVFVASMALLFAPPDPDSLFVTFLVYSLLVKAPYIVGHAVLLVLNLGVLLQLDIPDFGLGTAPTSAKIVPVAADDFGAASDLNAVVGSSGAAANANPPDLMVEDA